ncbi:nuclear transport factor 2 family protein [Novosphingobium sp. KCTC 2891]|uniref:nuclear transport factor 2 family protein n=1 Tax=Novosphingobium sp. KCTC 2891 TaxID=2989730 RepID=UPI002223941C|nr:nuclear transport factor 2 family protein [Novosphingobium sp. KCTC 2891]MCW1382551.1 nuclear transport factor 2 family protein [Novosphingobium sp. KCTC 2891]
MAFDLEAEVRDLAARRDIHDALCRYMRGQDRLDPVLHRSAFHDDAWVDCGLMNGSADEFVSFAQGFLADIEGSQHIIAQAQISVDGDKASGEVYFYAWHRTVEDGEPKDLIVAGRYIDEYACRNGDWRIVRRKELVDWARTDPAADAFLKDNDLPRGLRRGQDFSQTRAWPV